jgi:hypothetical protein
MEYDRWEKDIDSEQERDEIVHVDDIDPLLPGLSGDWVAKNPIVWDVLQPVLGLTSRILASAYIVSGAS